MSDDRTRHSPGPWRWDDRTGTILSGADGGAIIVGQIGFLTPEADARLIAAAPEMLRALIDLLDNTNDPISAENLCCSGPPCPMTDGACETCRARALLDRIEKGG